LEQKERARAGAEIVSKSIRADPNRWAAAERAEFARLKPQFLSAFGTFMEKFHNTRRSLFASIHGDFERCSEVVKVGFAIGTPEEPPTPTADYSEVDRLLAAARRRTSKAFPLPSGSAEASVEEKKEEPA
jgi:hypothetical protein